jgi:hypothetical protein
MRILFDEGVPIPAMAILGRVLPGHDTRHIYDVKWGEKKDVFVYRDAKRAGYDVIVTNDHKQMSDPEECRAVRRSGLHRVSYEQKEGIRGLALTCAAIIAALPDIVEELARADGQRLVTITGLHTSAKRYEVTDPRRDPPRYWT